MNPSADRPLPALILDLDGTIADTLDDITNAVNHAIGFVRNGSHDRLTVRSMIGDGLSTLMARAAETDDQVTIAYLIRRFQEHYDEHHLATTRLYDGAAEFLARCDRAGVLLNILSNKPHEYTLLICDELLDAWSFGAILGARDGLPIKPDPTAAVALASAMKRDPSDIVFVGDSVVDVETAQAAGMRSVAVTWGFQDREPLFASGPDYLADDFDELWAAVLSVADQNGGA